MKPFPNEVEIFRMQAAHDAECISAMKMYIEILEFQLAKARSDLPTKAMKRPVTKKPRAKSVSNKHVFFEHRPPRIVPDYTLLPMPTFVTQEK